MFFMMKLILKLLQKLVKISTSIHIIKKAQTYISLLFLLRL